MARLRIVEARDANSIDISDAEDTVSEIKMGRSKIPELLLEEYVAVPSPTLRQRYLLVNRTPFDLHNHVIP